MKTFQIEYNNEIITLHPHPSPYASHIFLDNNNNRYFSNETDTIVSILNKTTYDFTAEFHGVGSGSPCSIGGYTGWLFSFISPYHNVSELVTFYPDYNRPLPISVPCLLSNHCQQSGFDSLIQFNDSHDGNYYFYGGHYCYSSGSYTSEGVIDYHFDHVPLKSCCQLDFNSIMGVLGA